MNWFKSLERLAMTAAVLLSMVAGAFPAFAQPACPECRIELELVQRLGSLEADPAARYHASRVSWMSDGYFVIAAPATQRPEVATYKADGRFVAHRITRGEGPGEFMDRIVESSVVGGSIIVVEGTGRVHTFLPDLSHVSTQNLPISPYTRTVLVNGSIVDLVPLVGEDGERYMQHLLRPSGRGPYDIVRSFGVASDRLEEMRVAYVTMDGGFWVRFPALQNRPRSYQFVRNSQEFLASTEETESGDVEFLIWRLQIEDGSGGRTPAMHR